MFNKISSCFESGKNFVDDVIGGCKSVVDNNKLNTRNIISSVAGLSYLLVSVGAIAKDCGDEYEIKKGDTLWRISKVCNVAIQGIYNYNNGINPRKLQIGQKIKLNANSNSENNYKINKTNYLNMDVNINDSNEVKKYHLVKPGDSVYKIALKYEKNPADIIKVNNLVKPYIIYPNQKISLDEPLLEKTGTKLSNVQPKMDFIDNVELFFITKGEGFTLENLLTIFPNLNPEVRQDLYNNLANVFNNSDKVYKSEKTNRRFFLRNNQLFYNGSLKTNIWFEITVDSAYVYSRKNNDFLRVHKVGGENGSLNFTYHYNLGDKQYFHNGYLMKPLKDGSYLSIYNGSRYEFEDGKFIIYSKNKENEKKIKEKLLNNINKNLKKISCNDCKLKISEKKGFYKYILNIGNLDYAIVAIDTNNINYLNNTISVLKTDGDNYKMSFDDVNNFMVNQCKQAIAFHKFAILSSKFNTKIINKVEIPLKGYETMFENLKIIFELSQGGGDNMNFSAISLVDFYMAYGSKFQNEDNKLNNFQYVKKALDSLENQVHNNKASIEVAQFLMNFYKYKDNKKALYYAKSIIDNYEINSLEYNHVHIALRAKELIKLLDPNKKINI